MSPRTRVIAAGLIATAVAAAGCGGTSTGDAGSSTPRRGGTVTVGIDSDPGNFDTIADSTLGQSMVNGQIYDPPLRAGPDGKVQPGLVSKWKVGKRRIELTVRKGITFTDGTALDAAAIAATLNRARAKGTAYASLYDSVEKVSAKDASAVLIDLKQPDPSLVQILTTRAAYVTSPAAVKKHGGSYGAHPVGTGPFTLQSYTPNGEVVLKRNDRYWDSGRPYLDRLQFKIIPNAANKFAALSGGQLQTVDYINPVDAPRLKGNATLKLTSDPGVMVPYLAINNHQAPLNDPNVRQAISLALDRNVLAKNVFLGHAKPANSLLSPVYPDYDKTLPAQRADAARAKQLLAGKQVTLTMQVPPTYSDLAQVVKQQLAGAGITVNLKNMDWGTLVDTFYKQDFQLQVQDNTGTWPDARVMMSGFYSPDGAYNGLKYRDPQIVKALDGARTADDAGRARSFYGQAQRSALNANVYVPLVWLDNLRATAAAVHGIPKLPTGLLDFRGVWVN